VTSGSRRIAWRDPRGLTTMAFVAFGLVYMMVNATTLIDQRQALGQPIATWRAWLLEATSFLAWLIVLPAILWTTQRLLALRRLSLVVAAHVAACIAMSLLHSLIMFVLRAVTFAIAGDRYSPAGSIAGTLVFEFRKDIITFVSIVLVFHIARRLMAETPQATSDHGTTDTLIEVRDGNRTLWIKPEEIDWVSAAGNYVELHGTCGTLLARRKLSDVETELASHGFVRVHRSRLVRQASIASIETRQSGDFDMLLRSGEAISGSRRFRANLRK
jgi:DNA-binding LytR/AlgR family response regulator